MLQSKKFWIVSLLLLLTGFFTWFWLSGHATPAYAKYIPRDAHGVLTINSKRLAADLIFGGSQKQDTASSYHRKLDQWKKAAERNGGTGLNLTSDILAFGNIHPEKKAWYNGVIIKMEDETKLIRFIRQELPGLLDTSQIHMTTLIENSGYRSLVIVNDESESPVCIGFNKEVLVILRAGFHLSDPAFFNKELKRIFHLSPDSCILSIENFRRSQHRASDLSLWYNMDNSIMKNLLKATPHASQDGYLNAWLNFNKGGATVDIMHVTAHPETEGIFDFEKNNASGRFLDNLPKDEFFGLLYTHLNLHHLINRLREDGKEGPLEHLFGKWGLTTEEITSDLNGDIQVSFNGIVHYQEKYIAYEYDDNFNQKEVEHYRDSRIPGFKMYIGKNDAHTKMSLLPKLVQNNYLVPYKKGARLNSDFPLYMTDLGDCYYVSNVDSWSAESKREGVAVHRKELETLLKSFYTGGFLDLAAIDKQINIENKDTARKGKISEVFTSISLGVEEEKDKGTLLKISFKCTDPASNALIQLLNSTSLRERWNQKP